VSKQFTFGKNERLKSRKRIKQLFNGGKKITVPPYRVLYIVEPAETYSLSFSAGVSAKNFKKAVDRNRIKRLTREAYRLQKQTLQEKIKEKKIGLNVFFIYTARELPSYDEVYKKIGSVLNKLLKVIEG
jgi:ribonuclease P protein component